MMFSYVVTGGDGIMLSHGSTTWDIIASICLNADWEATVMFGPYDGTGE